MNENTRKLFWLLCNLMRISLCFYVIKQSVVELARATGHFKHIIMNFIPRETPSDVHAYVVHWHDSDFSSFAWCREKRSTLSRRAMRVRAAVAAAKEVGTCYPIRSGKGRKEDLSSARVLLLQATENADHMDPRSKLDMILDPNVSRVRSVRHKLYIINNTRTFVCAIFLENYRCT